MASKRAAAAISSAADGDDDKEESAPAAGPGEEGGKKPRTLLEAAKELKKATANMDAGTIKQMRAKEEEHRMLKEANQVRGGGASALVRWFGCCRRDVSFKEEKQKQHDYIRFLHTFGRRLLVRYFDHILRKESCVFVCDSGRWVCVGGCVRVVLAFYWEKVVYVIDSSMLSFM